MAVEKKKIVILGGGLSSLVTAYELTSVPGWRDHSEITVYQMGWRLGGKGASGRNRKDHDRIEEHGLHLFFGFYENAFKTMRAVYRELGRNPDAPLSTWEQAFKKRTMMVMDQQFDGEWKHWPMDMPENTGVPGDGGLLFNPWLIIEEIVEVLLGQVKLWRGQTRDPHIPTGIEFIDGLGSQLEALIASALHVEAHASLELARALIAKLPRDPRQHTTAHHDMLLWLLRGFRKDLARELEDLVDSNWEAFKLFTLVDLGISAIIGMIADDLILPPVNWQKLDDQSFFDWLKKHGATQATVDSAPIRALASGAFATGPDASGGAGTVLYLTLRAQFTFKGSFLWEMQAGMGDTIFGPLYTVLKRRGVRFEFFQRVDNVGLSEPDASGKRIVNKITIGQQATLKNGSYVPLYDVKGLPCWPSEPFYDQLNEGPALEAGNVNLENWWTDWKDPVPPKTLEVGRDFDTVVLGISLGALPYICPELIADTANPAFKNMIATVKTTLTQATQLWFTPDLPKLGWRMPKPVVVGYTDPFDTWADMSHLIQRETWPAGVVGNVAYLCMRLPDEGTFNPLSPPPRSDHHYPFRLLGQVEGHVHKFLTQDVHHLWPWATTPNRRTELNWDWLVDPKDREGIDRLRAQYWVADWNPSDRYVLSVTGSTKARLMPHQSGYANLILTGDWTRNGFSAGCVEATVASGMHASRAICGLPKEIIGEWMDDLPHHQRHTFDPGESETAALAPTKRTVDAGRFLQRDGDMLALQPYRAEGATLNWFVLASDMTALQQLCDDDLNIGGRSQPVRYRPFLPLVCFIACDIKKLHSKNSKDDQGWMPERDYAFWVPVMAGREVDGKFEAERFGFYNPYMFVDSGPAAAGGREVYGMLKSVSEIFGPKVPADEPKFTVKTFVIPEVCAANEVVPRELIRVQDTQSSQWGDHPQTWGSKQDAVRELEQLIAAAVADLDQMEANWDFDLDLLRSALTGDTRMVSLKQFPDTQDAHRACYQAIIETMSVPVSPLQGGLLKGGPYAVDIQNFQSHQIVKRLGLHVTAAPGGDGWQRAESRINFQVKFDFDLDDGKVVYRSV